MRTCSSLIRTVLAPIMIAGVLPMTAAAASLEMLTTGGCECCHAWARHMRAGGHDVVVTDLAMGRLMKMKLDAGIPATLTACHTAKVEGYLIEGHVPEPDVRRLLIEKPDAIGLIVPGMPTGSPGMERGDKVEPYEVLLLRRDGSTEVYASYPRETE